jgi:hypothetical protein
MGLQNGDMVFVPAVSRKKFRLGRVLAEVVRPWPFAAKTRFESQPTTCGMLSCRADGNAGTGSFRSNCLCVL